MEAIQINRNSPITVIKQITANLIFDIEKGIYKKGEKLLSINCYSSKHGVSRDTIERAYKKAVQQGYVIAVKGKGYYVAGVPDTKIKVLVIFNMLVNEQKGYESIIKTLGDKAKLGINVYETTTDKLKEIVENNLNYTTVILLPHL